MQQNYALVMHERFVAHALPMLNGNDHLYHVRYLSCLIKLTKKSVTIEKP